MKTAPKKPSPPVKSAAKTAAPAQSLPKTAAKAGVKNALPAATKVAAQVTPKATHKADTKPAAKPAVKLAVKPAAKVPAKASQPAPKQAASKAKPAPPSKTPAKPAPAKSIVSSVKAKLQAMVQAVVKTKPSTSPTPQANSPVSKPPVKTTKAAATVVASKPVTAAKAAAAPLATVAASIAPAKARLSKFASKAGVPFNPQPTDPSAAKSSFFKMPAPVHSPAPIAIAKKDAKLANNWKSKTAAQLTDAEALAMSDNDYMNDIQMAFFRLKLVTLKEGILSNAGATTEHLREDTSVVPDPADRATIEEEHALELRTRDRERKLLKKIEQSIVRIDAGDYGYCDETGEPIGVGRLIARPTASLSIEAQQRRELKQKMFGD